MFQSGDVRVSLSSIEFSLLYPSHQTPRYCPSCGFYLPTVTFGEIRLSSVIFILGVGSFICYKLFMHRRRKRKKSLTSCIAYSFGGLLSRGKSCGNFDSFQDDPSYFVESPSTPPSPNSLICESMESDFDSYLAQSLEKYLIRKSSSPSTLSIAAPEDRTIAKLDQLLQQIEEIKESVGELNLDFVEIRKKGSQPIKERPEADSITPNADEISNLLTKEELSLPSLEWDSNDVAFSSEYGELEYGDYDSVPDSAELAANLRSFKSFSSTSGVSSFSASDTASHCGENQEMSRLRLIQNLIDEARRLGILPDLMKLLLRNSTRDSAFFED
ncbi:uncharacterized protein LOC141856815 isoform X2 [Brevipalpus obovatus]|uniref:uncharacterized protein LOC141856815 isoform X2 n=1 Tax=Brevipalpus obovatus TaxID=246614 RepID=UPI003D9E48B8